MPVILRDADGTTWGPRREDLNRLSFSTFVDRELLYAIARFTNADGYCAGYLPSLWHRGGALGQEVALCQARGLVSNVFVERPAPGARPTLDATAVAAAAPCLDQTHAAIVNDGMMRIDSAVPVPVPVQRDAATG
jgi:hypothetical protein